MGLGWKNCWFFGLVNCISILLSAFLYSYPSKAFKRTYMQWHSHRYAQEQGQGQGHLSCTYHHYLFYYIVYSTRLHRFQTLILKGILGICGSQTQEKLSAFVRSPEIYRGLVGYWVGSFPSVKTPDEGVCLTHLANRSSERNTGTYIVILVVSGYNTLRYDIFLYPANQGFKDIMFRVVCEWGHPRDCLRGSSESVGTVTGLS